MRKQSGITLVSLIIAIIVLLILAGVSISLLTDETNVAQKARDAGEAWNAAVVNEAEQVNSLLQELDEQTNP